MKKLFNFLNRNIAKILWSLAILIWAGIGIYYFSTTNNFSSFQSFVSRIILNPTPTLPLVPTPTPLENFDEIESIIGNFVKWEDIQSSKDRYILLNNPDTNESFPKIRVGFEFSSLFGYGQEDITVFAVEKNEKEYDVLYALKYFTSEEIDKLIKKGDSIKIVLTQEHEKEINRKDENGNYLAHWLFIQRSEGKAEVEKELGREIQKPKI